MIFANIYYHSGSLWLSQLYINTEIVYSLFPRSIVLFYSIANRKMRSLHTRNMALYPRGLFYHYSNTVVFLQSVCLLVRQALPQSWKDSEVSGLQLLSLLSSFYRYLFLYLYIYVYVYECVACVYVFMPSACLLLTEVRRGHQDLLELELWTAVGYHVTPGNQDCLDSKFS